MNEVTRGASSSVNDSQVYLRPTGFLSHLTSRVVRPSFKSHEGKHSKLKEVGISWS